MCLRFVFLLIRRAAAWLRLSRRKEAWKTAEILILRHQLAVLQRLPLALRPVGTATWPLTHRLRLADLKPGEAAYGRTSARENLSYCLLRIPDKRLIQEYHVPEECVELARCDLVYHAL
jgi:hypothetical protein